MRVQRPKCRNCGRKWFPEDDVLASRGYCRVCRAERKSTAARFVGSDMSQADKAKEYTYNLPRIHQRKWM